MQPPQVLYTSEADGPVLGPADGDGYRDEVGASGLLATIQVVSEFDVLEAQLAARELTVTIGFDEREQASVVTAVSELASNLVAHSFVGGSMKLTAVERGEQIGVEVLCVDEGPGMEDVARSLATGFSTAGTLGFGLRAVTRMMDRVEISTSLGVGSAIIAWKWRRS